MGQTAAMTDEPRASTTGDQHRDLATLEAGLDHIRRSPDDEGRLERIVARPDEDERRVLAEGTLDLDRGLVGDNWKARGNRRTPDGAADPLAQVTIANARAVDLLAGTPDRWALAGDQLYVDFDLSEANAPAGTRLHIGEAVLEITPKPHTGCAKFRRHFGADGLRFVNSAVGTQLHLRGVNARVVEAGRVAQGDRVRKA
jgi:MOSC domain-containing protein YiiM